MLIYSSFCVLNFILTVCRTNFVKVVHIKGRAGLVKVKNSVTKLTILTFDPALFNSQHRLIYKPNFALLTERGKLFLVKSSDGPRLL